MAEDRPSQASRLITQSADGDLRATDELLPLVYEELRELAAALMRREGRHRTPSPGDLVHEAYLRLLGPEELTWKGRGHFFGAAAQAMRRILIERARHYAAEKHGAGLERITLSSSVARVELSAEEFLDLDRALNRLEAQDERMASVVRLRFFAGLSIKEIAQALDLSTRTVDRLWTGGRTWLHRELTRGGHPDPA